MMTAQPCYCASLPKSIYADKDSPAPKCDFCSGARDWDRTEGLDTDPDLCRECGLPADNRDFCQSCEIRLFGEGYVS